MRQRELHQAVYATRDGRIALITFIKPSGGLIGVVKVKDGTLYRSSWEKCGNSVTWTKCKSQLDIVRKICQVKMQGNGYEVDIPASFAAGEVELQKFYVNQLTK